MLFKTNFQATLLVEYLFQASVSHFKPAFKVDSLPPALIQQCRTNILIHPRNLSSLNREAAERSRLEDQSGLTETSIAPRKRPQGMGAGGNRLRYQSTPVAAAGPAPMAVRNVSQVRLMANPSERNFATRDLFLLSRKRTHLEFCGNFQALAVDKNHVAVQFCRLCLHVNPTHDFFKAKSGIYRNAVEAKCCVLWSVSLYMSSCRCM